MNNLEKSEVVEKKSTNPIFIVLPIITLILAIIFTLVYSKINANKTTDAIHQLNNQSVQISDELASLNSQILTLQESLNQAQGEEEINTFENWQTYSNSVWSFSFKYPAEWSVIKSSLPETLRGSLPFELVQVGRSDFTADNNLNQSLESSTKSRFVLPSMYLWVDPTGWGAISPNYLYGIKQTADAGFMVTSESSYQFDNNAPEFQPNPNVYLISAKPSSVGSGERNFYMSFYQSLEEKENWQDTVKQILSTFKFD